MSDPEEDLDCVQFGALIHRHDYATLRITGGDRLKWLNGLITCDLAPLTAGRGAYGLFVAKNGKIKSEAFVLVGEEDLWVGLPRGLAQEIAGDLERHLVMEDAEIGGPDESLVWCSILGLRAPEANVAAVSSGVRAASIQRRGVPTTLVAVTSGGLDALVAAVSAAAGPSHLSSDEGWARVRVEQGIPEWGVDFDASHYPQEASLESDGVSFQKGCYLGQEAVFMLQNRGHVKKRLVQLVVEGDVSRGDVITNADGEEQGLVTSPATRPGRSLVLGWVKYKSAAPDTALFVAGRPAKVTDLLALK